MTDEAPRPDHGFGNGGLDERHGQADRAAAARLKEVRGQAAKSANDGFHGKAGELLVSSAVGGVATYASLKGIHVGEDVKTLIIGTLGPVVGLLSNMGLQGLKAWGGSFFPQQPQPPSADPTRNENQELKAEMAALKQRLDGQDQRLNDVDTRIHADRRDIAGLRQRSDQRGVETNWLKSRSDLQDRELRRLGGENAALKEEIRRLREVVAAVSPTPEPPIDNPIAPTPAAASPTPVSQPAEPQPVPSTQPANPALSANSAPAAEPAPSVRPAPSDQSASSAQPDPSGQQPPRSSRPSPARGDSVPASGEPPAALPAEIGERVREVNGRLEATATRATAAPAWANPDTASPSTDTTATRQPRDRRKRRTQE